METTGARFISGIVDTTGEAGRTGVVVVGVVGVVVTGVVVDVEGVTEDAEETWVGAVSRL